MNERIKELYRQANEQAIQNACIKNNTLRPQNNTVWNEFVPLFAEMIVKECMNICKQHPSRYPYNNWNADAVAPHLVQQFEEHFGVEE